MKREGILGLLVFLGLCFLVSPAQAGDIKIGVIFPFTGKMAIYGEDGRRALDYAMDEINAAGGIKGNRVEFIYEDSTGTPKGGVSAAQKLIQIDKVDAIIGTLFSSVTLAVKPIVTTHKIVVVAPMASNLKIYSGTKYVFSVTPTDNDITYVNAKYCRQVLGKKTLGTLYMMNDTGIDKDRLITKWWTYLGGKVLIHENFLPGSTDFRTQLTKIRAANPEVLYLDVTWREGVKVLKQLAEMKMKMHVAATSQVREPKLLELAGEAAEGMTFTTAYQGGTQEDKALKEKYEKGFKARYNQPPKIVAWRTYDCARVVFEAMKRGGRKGDSLRDEIVKLNIPGVFGHIQFREDGSPIKDQSIWKVEKGQFVEVGFVDHAP